jgi:hypothetical protein
MTNLDSQSSAEAWQAAENPFAAEEHTAGAEAQLTGPDLAARVNSCPSQQDFVAGFSRKL